MNLRTLLFTSILLFGLACTDGNKDSGEESASEGGSGNDGSGNDGSGDDGSGDDGSGDDGSGSGSGSGSGDDPPPSISFEVTHQIGQGDYGDRDCVMEYEGSGWGDWSCSDCVWHFEVGWYMSGSTGSCSRYQWEDTIFDMWLYRSTWYDDRWYIQVDTYNFYHYQYYNWTAYGSNPADLTIADGFYEDDWTFDPYLTNWIEGSLRVYDWP